MTGATGSVGNYVGRKLVQQGHEIVVVSRSAKKAKMHLEFPAEVIEADLVQTALSEEHFKNIDTVIHLMGETVDGRWNEKKKSDIFNSRINSSQNLIKNLPTSVQTVVSASAQGIYGDSGDTELSDLKPHIKSQTVAKDDFLATVCEQWEAPFRKLNQRTVQLRIGIVLDPQSGALKKMVPLFQKGLGGTLGSGKQYMSWIAIDDLSDIIVEAVTNSVYTGAINCCSPENVTNDQFTIKLCQALGVFKSAPVPEFALKIVIGEMAKVVLASIRMRPDQLIKNKYAFKFTNLENYFKSFLQEFKDGHSFLSVKQYLAKDINTVFQFFSEAKNLEKTTPNILNFRIDKMSTPEIEKSTIIDYKLKIRGFPANWRTQIVEWSPPHRFIDTQLNGPYKLWHHTHDFEKMGTGTLMIDKVRYKLPLGFAGNLVAQTFVQKDVESIFKFRREVVSDL